MGIDKQTLIQIIVLLFFAGTAIVQVLFRVLAKGAQRPRAPGEPVPRGGPAEKPFKDVREFLKEIRSEVERGAAGRQGEPKKVPVPGEGQVIVWEVVEEPKTSPLAPLAGAPARGRGERPARPAARGRGRAAERPPAGRPAPRGEPAQSVNEYLQDLARRDRDAGEAASAPAEESPVASMETVLGGTLEARAPTVDRTPLHPVAIMEGLTLRDAMIAQVILGPPRCRGPRRTRK